ncbi:MAG: regulator of sigma protease [Patescibacteria group bacterium]|nr:regulator of sigma protease [Patescibacteria group bacterium]
MQTIILNLLALSLVVFFHELGHFLAARKVGCTPKQFAVGLGPKIWSFVRKGTEFSLRWIPFGGFVEIQPEDTHKLTNRQQIFIYAAGPLANLVLCLALSVVIISFKQNFGVRIFTDYSYLVQIIAVIGATIYLFFAGIPMVIVALAKMAIHPISNTKDISGPIGIISGDAVPSSLIENTPVWLQLAITVYILSMGVGSFNLIPLSFLDGGRIFENLFSKFPKFTNLWRNATSIALGLLVVYILFTDIVKFIARF